MKTVSRSVESKYCSLNDLLILNIRSRLFFTKCEFLSGGSTKIYHHTKENKSWIPFEPPLP